MLNPEDILVVVDRVEDDTFTGDKGAVKKYKSIITFAGETYKIGEKLAAKWPLLEHGVALKLTMESFTKNGEEVTYVKNFDRCFDITPEKVAELSKPAPKNPKDLSIERQVAVKCVSELMAAGIEVPEDIKDLTLDWIRSALK
jgi:hypothetical protein